MGVIPYQSLGNVLLASVCYYFFKKINSTVLTLIANIIDTPPPTPTEVNLVFTCYHNHEGYEV